jgi:hypothetical protein
MPGRKFIKEGLVLYKNVDAVPQHLLLDWNYMRCEKISIFLFSDLLVLARVCPLVLTVVARRNSNVYFQDAQTKHGKKYLSAINCLPLRSLFARPGNPGKTNAA